MASLPKTKQEGETLTDAWDYKGRPAVRSTTGGWTSAAMILGIELCERLTTLGIAVNLITYITNTMHIANVAAAATTVTNFFGTSFMLSLLGGFIADTFFGRYLTIAIFATVQATVRTTPYVTILTISTIIPTLRPQKCVPGSGEPCIPATGKQLLVLYVALYLTALGTGGLKSSVSGFGSDQFDESNVKEKKQMIKFFNWFFFFISIGALLAVTVLVYIEDNLGREYGYGICACAILVGLTIFLSGTKQYRFKKLVGSPLTQIASVVVAAWRKRHLQPPSDASLFFDIDDNVGDEGKRNMKEKLPHSTQLCFLDKAAIKDPEVPITIANNNKWYLSTLTDVEEVKLVIRMLPTWATTVMFWTVIAQMTTFSVSQATTMDRRIGKSFQIPPASLIVFGIVTSLLVVALYDRIIAPVCQKVLKDPQALTPLQRIGVGLVLSIFAMVAAALLEIKRSRMVQSQDLQKITVQLRFFWLVPQMILVGSGEMFMYSGQLDFFLRECPKGMKTMSTGLFLSTVALGYFVSSILVSIVHKVTSKEKPWLADNINRGRLYNFYWLVTILSILNLVLFLACARGYVYKEKRLSKKGIVLEETESSCNLVRDH